MRQGIDRSIFREPARSGSAGFTLIELLMALTLVGLLSVVLVGGLRFGTRVWETGHQRSESFAKVEAVHGFLRRQLSQSTVSIRLNQSTDDPWDFEGLPDRVRFMAPLSAHVGVDGLYRFELAPVERSEGTVVELTWQLYRPDRVEWFDDDASRRTLIEDIEAIRLRYYGSLDGDDDPDWHESWDSQARLPALLKLELDFPSDDDRVWPELTVAPRFTGP